MICLVSDRRRVGDAPDAIDRVVDLVRAAARAGIDLIQIRERDLETARLQALVRRCVDAAAGTRARVLVNDRADVALACGAHGVHLRGDSMAAPRVRALVGGGMTIGRSVHSAREAEAVARAGGVDFLIFGPMFQTRSKPGAGTATLEELSEVCARARLPVLAVGGMTAARAPGVAKAGAAGLAAIGLFVPPPAEPADAYLPRLVGELRRTFDTREPVS